MYAIEVGKLCHPGRRVWPEGADYNLRWGGHELRIFLAGATRREVEAVRSGPVEFGFFADPMGLFLITRFGSQHSFDCSYNWHRVAMEERTLPPPTDETSPALRAPCTIILVDAADGIVLALRSVRFSPEFTRALHRAIADQVIAPYNGAAHRRWADSITGQYSTHQLWDQCTTRCQGEE